MVDIRDFLYSRHEVCFSGEEAAMSGEGRE
jgi:hypothetical protein